MTAERQRDWGWPLLVVFFLLVAAAFAARALLNADTAPLISDTDDAMRLVTVRDLLAGQNWFDNVQHRLNTPYGAELHWSRLVDLPIAALLALFTTVFGPTAAVTITAYVWPLILLLFLLLLSAVLTTRLVGRRGRLPAVALPAVSLVAMAEFYPGRLDHHSIQILLMLALVSTTIAALDRPRFAWLAGLLAATAIAIGTESLPTVAAAIMAFGLVWVFRPERADALRAFGLGFTGAALVHLALALPPERWLQPACDALSIVYVAVAVAVGIVYLALSFLRTAHPLLRIAALAIGGVLVGLVVVVGYPACLAGPYAGLDPWLVENWLSGVSEAEPVWRRFIADPAYTLGMLVPPLLALAVTALRVIRGAREGRGAWLVYGLYLVLAVVVMLVQIRGGRFAAILSTPGGALAIVWLRERYLARQSVPNALGLVAGWVFSAGFAIYLAVNALTLALPSAGQAAKTADTSACFMPEAYADLAALPPERVMTPVDLGAHVLAFTPHEVVAAPYHRNQLGVRDAFRFFSGPIDNARIILDMRGIGLVVVCDGMRELVPDGAPPDSFVALRAAGNLPDWLEPQTLPGSALEVYSVRR